MNITYKQLADRVWMMTPEQQRMDVMLLIPIEEDSIPVKVLYSVQDSDV